jgi:hypothetical protein
MMPMSRPTQGASLIDRSRTARRLIAAARAIK